MREDTSKQKPARQKGRRTGALVVLVLLLIVVFLVGGYVGWFFASQKSAATPQLEANALDTVREAVTAKVQPSIVQVNVILAQGAALGSRVIVDRRGYIVTNNHVVRGAHSIHVMLFNGTWETAQISGTDPNNDLAVLKIAVPKGGYLLPHWEILRS